MRATRAFDQGDENVQARKIGRFAGNFHRVGRVFHHG
jgi:hypothetical protein